jgi:hypothetical protein
MVQVSGGRCQACAAAAALAAVLFLPLPSRGAEALKGICEREGNALVGTKPFTISKGVRAPKRIRYVAPRFPELPRDTRVDVGGVWIGEMLIDAHGEVAYVWPIREFKLTPPFPAFNQAIVDGFRQSKYEPPKVNGKPTPVCMTVTTQINFS